MLTIYEKKDSHFPSNKDKPLLLFVSIKPTTEGSHVTISGIKNPLPFKEAIIKKGTICIRDWLVLNGWLPVGFKYEKN